MCTEVIYLQQAQIDTATQLLTKAFDTDLFFRYLTPEVDPARTNALRLICNTVLRYSQPLHHTYTTPSDLKGIAAWIPPDKSSKNMIGWLQAGAYRLPFGLGLSRTLRLKELIVLEEEYYQDMPQPHWYLMMLGVAPAYQGQGIGSLLVQPVLQKADCEGLPCYVETSNEAAVRFYQKHGFEIVRTDELSDNALRYWMLKRKPLSR